jgi:uncharacterized protein YndB with AHSA1/START domain
MSVTQEPSGRRSVQVEVEVPGTPDEVWQAIGTGPGISSWFVPTSFEERDGKAVALTVSFGPGMEARSVVTHWDPPRMFANSSEGWMPGSPPMASEWSVEARAGGVCIVRIVHSLFASTDEWDNQLEATASAWPAFLRNLRLYLAHFRGQRSAIMQVMTPVGTEADAWETLTSALGVKGVRVGQHWSTPAGVSPLSGVLEYLTENPYDALLRLDKPGPGIAALGAQTYPGGPSMVAMNFYMYGDQAADTVARATPVWQAWLQERFPMPAEPIASE